jgi:hypothetical protein
VRHVFEVSRHRGFRVRRLLSVKQTREKASFVLLSHQLIDWNSLFVSFRFVESRVASRVINVRIAVSSFVTLSSRAFFGRRRVTTTNDAGNSDNR